MFHTLQIWVDRALDNMHVAIVQMGAFHRVCAPCRHQLATCVGSGFESMSINVAFFHRSYGFVLDTLQVCVDRVPHNVDATVA